MLTMMSLGDFAFQLPTIVYQSFAHKRSARFAANPRMGTGDAFQYVGPGPEAISLSGVSAMGITSAEESYYELNLILAGGRERSLVDALGNVFGEYVLISMDIDRENFSALGAARRSEFKLELERVDDPGAPSLGGALGEIVERGAQLAANPLSIARFL